MGVPDDQRFARRVAEFLETANGEGHSQRGKASRHQQTDWKQREHDKSDDYERFAAMFIGEMRSGNDAQCGREHFDGGEQTHLFSADSDVIHREDHHPGVGNSFAKADQDVTQE